MVIVVDAVDATTNVKKRMTQGSDIFVRARDFYHAHEDMRGELIQVCDEDGTPLYALRFVYNVIEGIPAHLHVPTYVNPYWEYSDHAPRMDFSYLEAHDAYLFLGLEEYSCFMARLIRERYPHKLVAFADQRARWFFEDVELADSVEQLVEAHPALAGAKVLTVAGDLRAARAIKDPTYAVSATLMASVFWASESTSYGSRNPDKLFYLIKPEVGESGLAKFLEFTVGFYDLALRKRADIGCDIIPVVDTGIPGDDNQFNGGDGRDVWRMFFEPLGAYPLEEVYDSANVIVSQEGNVTVNPYLLAIKRNPNVSALIGRYVKLNEQTQAYCERMYERVVPSDSGRILGVVGRGTDFNNPIIVRFRQKPLAPQDLCDKVCTALAEGTFDTVFLATEDQRVFDAFMASDIADRVCFVEQPRYDLSQGDDQNKLLIDVYREDEADNPRDGYADTLRYLSILYILTKADALIASTECGATIFAQGYRDEPYEFVDIFGAE